MEVTCLNLVLVRICNRKKENKTKQKTMTKKFLEYLLTYLLTQIVKEMKISVEQGMHGGNNIK